MVPSIQGDWKKTKEALRSPPGSLENAVGAAATHFSGESSGKQVSVPSVLGSVHMCKNCMDFSGIYWKGWEHPSYCGAFFILYLSCKGRHKNGVQDLQGFPHFHSFLMLLCCCFLIPSIIGRQPVPQAALERGDLFLSATAFSWTGVAEMKVTHQGCAVTPGTFGCLGPEPDAGDKASLCPNEVITSRDKITP